jgi:pimeloyl-ACP methyl ester carboxylesterase
MSTPPIARFEIRVPDEVLADLRERLARARWPEPLEDPDWAYGVEQGYLRDLARTWAEVYDWRRHEAELNRFAQFTTEIEGQTLHFLHVRSKAAAAVPLIISHGWPGSIVEFTKIIGPLTDPAAHGGNAGDAFDVVCPSLPGYGFSQPNNARGWNPRRVGRAWAELMRRLGYQRYGAQGGDWGSFVSQFVAREDPERCFAIHLNFMFSPPTSPELMENMSEEEQAQWARFQHYVNEESGYAQIQSTKPQTLGYGLNDSPVGLLAWIAEKFRTWTDCDGEIENAITRDELLTNVTLYWVTGTAPSSGRLYRETRLSDAFGVQPYLETPVGYACFPKEIVVSPLRWLEKHFNVVHLKEMPRGGHFAALEQPELLVEDVRRFYRRWR